MQVTRTELEGVLILEPQVFGDERGFFMETFNQHAFDAAIGRHVTFVQDNHSRSGRGVLRGLHYQVAPHAQGKLVRVTQGSIFDVAVDLRRSSATFAHWVAIELSARNRRQLWIPAGFAHGFAVLGEEAEVLYKTSAYYHAASEISLRWDDPVLAIDWPAAAGPHVLSAKDAVARPFADAPTFD